MGGKALSVRSLQRIAQSLAKVPPVAVLDALLRQSGAGARDDLDLDGVYPRQIGGAIP